MIGLLGSRRRRETSHRDLVRALVVKHLPALHARVRRSALDRIVSDLVELEPFDGPFATESEAQQLATLVQRMQQVVAALEEEERQLDARFARFSDLFFKVRSDERRRRVMHDYLVETVTNRRQLRGDLKALDRWLGYDVLRERNELRRARVLVTAELGLAFLGGAAAEVIAADRDQGGPAQVAASSLFRFLRLHAESCTRWQSRLAAAQSLATMARALVKAGQVEAIDPEEIRATLRLTSASESSAWVQAQVLELVVVLLPEWGRAVLRRRLLESPSRAVRDDFLVRRRALEIAAKELPTAELATLCREVAERRDESEHVRLGLVEVIGSIAEEDSVALLRRIVLDGQLEKSARVRAAALVAVRRASVAGLGNEDDRLASMALQVIVDALPREEAKFALRVACEELTVLATHASAAGRSAWLESHAASMRGALQQLLARPQLAPVLVEKVSDTLEILARELSAERRAWTKHVTEVAGTIAPGTSLVMAAKSADLPEMPDDPAFLGRVLADVSRTGFGLYAQREGDSIRLWRGDVFERRAWRVLHEMTHPAPNKRQAFVHTVGRSMPALVRAHPGGMHEVTATVVPGERIDVGGGAGWGRHLPTVDDLLDLPLVGDEAVRVFSSHGVTTIASPKSITDRLRNRLTLTRRYADLASLRLSSLRGREPAERRKYLESLENLLGVRVTFEPHAEAATRALAAPSVSQLFEAETTRAPIDGGKTALGGGLAMSVPFARDFHDWLSLNGYYFTSPIENGPQALGLFTAGLLTFFLADAWSKRSRIDPARESIPLCIGGWGTRGKSGTERLKAALFHGLGFEVFSKTTGSEAMFIHSTPAQAPAELFIYRPYDKATIWEQKDMLLLGSKLKSEVFLWECMALNPQFVELLEHDWMRDDVTTLTNAYPDHEDIQGPAGVNVAEVISRFIPQQSTVVTSEDNFLPLFDDVAKQRKTRLIHVPDRDAELLGDDFLARFPYQEHPRNIALVGQLAEHLGVDKTFAIALMADHIVPELGNLKIFPPVRVNGRTLVFINGHSANERTGFLNNWTRTGLDAADPVSEPHRAVVTVVNNRWDRVARSEVFARILVEDAAADKHVLIGTNLKGLYTYVERALDRYLAGIEVVQAGDVETAEGRKVAEGRLSRQFARLRIPPATVAAAMERLKIYAAGAGLAIDPAKERGLASAIEAAFEGEVTSYEALRTAVGALPVASMLEGALVERPVVADAAAPEVLDGATRDDVKAHFLERLAQLAAHGRLARMLEMAGNKTEIDAVNEAFRRTYREIFLSQVETVEDPSATGDQIIERCSRIVPPGTRAEIMGLQNIKGTGLDWVYRWVALDTVRSAIERVRGEDAEKREAALRELETFEDFGLVDTALARVALPEAAKQARSQVEAKRIERLAAKVEGIYAQRRAALTSGRKKGRVDEVIGQVEKAVDYLDSVHRRRKADRILEDLVDERISHPRAILELRKLNARQKGGWLGAMVGR